MAGRILDDPPGFARRSGRGEAAGLELLADAGLLQNLVCGVPGFDFVIDREAAGGYRAPPHFMVADVGVPPEIDEVDASHPTERRTLAWSWCPCLLGRFPLSLCCPCRFSCDGGHHRSHDRRFG